MPITALPGIRVLLVMGVSLLCPSSILCDKEWLFLSPKTVRHKREILSEETKKSFLKNQTHLLVVGGAQRCVPQPRRGGKRTTSRSQIPEMERRLSGSALKAQLYPLS